MKIRTYLSTLIVLLIPITQANVAELMTTSAGHMITTLISLYKDSAMRTTLPIGELLLKVYITRAIMLSKHTLRAKRNFAFGAFGKFV